MRCKLCPPTLTVEEELSKLVCKWYERGRGKPRFVLVGYDTYSQLRRSLIGDCDLHRGWDDFTVATPACMVAIAVDETTPTGMKIIPFAKDMRPGF